MLTCVHVLIRFFDRFEGGNTSRFKAAKSTGRLTGIVFSQSQILSSPETSCSFQDLVRLPDARAFRSQREAIVFCYPRNLVISNAPSHR